MKRARSQKGGENERSEGNLFRCEIKSSVNDQKSHENGCEFFNLTWLWSMRTRFLERNESRKENPSECEEMRGKKKEKRERRQRVKYNLFYSETDIIQDDITQQFDRIIKSRVQEKRDKERVTRYGEKRKNRRNGGNRLAFMSLLDPARTMANYTEWRDW